MNEWKSLGIVVMIGGAVIVLFGLVLLIVGKLPGDIVIKKGNFTFFFPIVTSILISIVLTLIFILFNKR